MATYFSGNGAEIQSDSMQTLYLMNPGYVGFPEPTTQGNLVLVNQHAGNSLPGNHQQFIGIPLPPAAQAFMGNQPGEVNSAFMASNLRQHSLWRNTAGELSFVQSIGDASPTAAASSANQFHIPAMASNSGHQTMGEIPPQLGLQREQQGGLSLSLSSSPVQFMAASNSFQSDVEAAGGMVPPTAAGGGVGGEEGGGEERRVKWEGGLQSVLLGSKYLKAAQELLDEVVNVGRGLKGDRTEKSPSKEGKAKKDPPAAEPEDAGGKRGSELTAAERQELQMKKAKLVGMLEEVDQRYRQYHHQMQMVVSSFEAVAGAGAAKTYTALALQTISKQFRCLRDAIAGQIRMTSKSLGEDDCLAGGKAEGSRLKYVDQQLRQQRALQQLGMMQHNAWRPQRGLPERSVSVLRAWLFEHFLHPYPKDADKHMLAKQTGLTRSQPMVEEMYMEEIKEHEKENTSEEKISKSETNEESAAMKSTSMDSPPPAVDMANSKCLDTISTDQTRSSPPCVSAAGCSLLASASSPDARILLDIELKQATSKRMAGNGFQDLNPLPSINADMDIKADGTTIGGFRRQSRDGYALAAAAAAAAADQGSSFGSYQLGDIGRFSHETFAPRITTNGVSLTLGLPHCDSLSLSAPQAAAYLSSQSMALGRRHELSSEPSDDFCSLNSTAAAAHPANAYDNINIQTRKRFAAQLLPDFVT
ncbi:BEL1-like homeodomain protein 1 [Nymphaea thermarum]|nr:BEL1-like homeodomain protein 1 [Nymphaea thermarum]